MTLCIVMTFRYNIKGIIHEIIINKLDFIKILMNMKPETLKLIQENIGDNKLLYVGLSNDYLDLTPKERQQRQK